MKIPCNIELEKILLNLYLKDILISTLWNPVEITFWL